MTRHTALLLLTTTVALTGCQDAHSVTEGATTGLLQIDVGGDETRNGGNEGTLSSSIDEVWLRIDEVSVHHETEGWVLLEDGREDVDLMAHRDGTTERLGSGQVYVGDYDALRLTIEDAWIVVDGEEQDLHVTSGFSLDKSLKLSVAIAVAESTSATVWVGWDLENTLSGSEQSWELDDNVNLSVDVDSE